MNNLKRMLITTFGTLFLALTMLFAASCGDDATYYSVTTNYDKAQGDVTISAPADEKGYTEGESVTVTVTAKDGFAVDAVKVNNAAVELTDGKYTFAIAGNTTVDATFKSVSVAAKSYKITVEDYETGSGTVTISAPADGNADGLYAENESVTITVTAAQGYTVGALKLNGEEVALTDGKYTFAITADVVVSVSFTEDKEDTLSFSEHYIGVWNSVTGEDAVGSYTLTITENSLVFTDNETETAIDVTVTKSTEIVDDDETFDVYTIVWNEDTFTLELTESIYLLRLSNDAATLYFLNEKLPEDLAIDESVYGTYSADNLEDFVIDATGISWGTHSVKLVGDLSDDEAFVYVILVDNAHYLLDCGDKKITLMGDLESSVEYVFTLNEDVQLEYTFPVIYRGEWLGLGEGDNSLVIGINSLKLNGVSATEAGMSEFDNLQFTIDGESYTVYIEGQIEGFILSVMNMESYESITFVKLESMTYEITEEKYFGDWVSSDGNNTLKIENNGITFNGETAYPILTTGFITSYTDMMGAAVPVNAICYYFYIGETRYFLNWNDTDKKIYVNSLDYGDGEFVFEEELQGTWVSLDKEDVFVIEEKKVTLNGTEIPYTYRDNYFHITWKEVEYSISVDASSEDFLILTDDDFNMLYLVKQSAYREDIKILQQLQGTWKSFDKTLTISENEFVLDGSTLKPFYEYVPEGAQSHTYYFVLNGARCEISLDLNYPDILTVATVNDYGFLENNYWVKEVTIESGEGIFEDKYRGVYADSMNLIIVNANSITFKVYVMDDNGDYTLVEQTVSKDAITVTEEENWDGTLYTNYSFSLNGVTVDMSFTENTYDGSITVSITDATWSISFYLTKAL